MQDSLSVTQESEMSWFNYTGMDRTYTNLVQFIAMDPIERITIDCFLSVSTVKGITQRLIPWTVDEFDSEVLGYLTFVDMQCITAGYHRNKLDTFAQWLFMRQYHNVAVAVVRYATDEL